MITSTGIGSGLDIESVISQLMAIEREPLANIDRKKGDIDIKISALGTLKSALTDLETSARSIGNSAEFGAFEAKSYDDDIFTAEAAPGAKIENHTIEITGLAQAHQLASQQFEDGENSTVPSKTYNFSSSGEDFSVTIDSTNNTLLGLRDAINDSTDNNTISASVLNLEGGSRLILTARNTGTNAAITADPDLFFEASPAVDATFNIDGFSAVSSSNNVSDVIPGVTINLVSEGTAKLETARNTDSLKELLDDFVLKFNTLVSSVDSLSEGDLSSDGTLRNIKSDLSRLFFEPLSLNGQELSPFRLGLTFDRDGTLSIDDEIFTAISTEDTKTFVEAMTDSETGFSVRVIEALNRYTDVGGLIDTKEDSLQSRKSTLDDQSSRLEFRLEQTEVRLRRQFTALDTLMSRLQATSSYLNDQLASLNFNNGP